MLIFIISSCSYLIEPEEERIFELSLPEKEFIKNIGYFNISNKRMGELASSRASSESVREYGSSMLDAFTIAQNELQALAVSKNTVAPDSLEVFSQLDINILSAIEGHHFDSAYLHHQIKNFQDSKRLINNFVNQGRDQDVINYAENYLSAISVHIDVARLRREKIRNLR